MFTSYAKNWFISWMRNKLGFNKCYRTTIKSYKKFRVSFEWCFKWKIEVLIPLKKLKENCWQYNDKPELISTKNNVLRTIYKCAREPFRTMFSPFPACLFSPDSGFIFSRFEPCDNYLFPNLKKWLAGNILGSNEEVFAAILHWSEMPILRALRNRIVWMTSKNWRIVEREV